MTASAAPSSDRLSDAERARLMAALDEDGYVVLPRRLPAGLLEPALAAIERIAVTERARDPAVTGVKVQNCVERDRSFIDLMRYEPALQLAYDAFGPMFQLCQSNLVSRPRDSKTVADFLSSSPWHADGPRPGLFPAVGGAMGLNYLKFGYFLTDLTHADGGPLQVVRGSHRRPELDRRGTAFRIDDHAADLVTFNVPAGTVVAFHQAQWHAAPPNRSAIERRNVYISYCPTWLKPFDREYPTAEAVAGHDAETRWLLGEPRKAQKWWLPDAEDLARMARFRRDADTTAVAVVTYD